MMPKLENIEVKDGFQVFSTTDHVLGLAAEIEAADVESPASKLYAKRLSLWLKSLSPKIRARFITRVEHGNASSLGVPRAQAIGKLGFKEYRHFVIVEIDPKTALNGLFFPYREQKKTNSVALLLDAARCMRELHFELTPLSRVETERLFVSDLSSWVADIGSVETGTKSLGVVRLVKPTSQPISGLSLARVLSKMSPVFEVRLSVERMNPTRAEVFLQKRLKQVSKDATGDAKASDLEETLLETSLNGQGLFQYEFLVIAERVTKEDLKRALGGVASSLKGLGDIQIETIGAAASLVASQAGSTPHVPLLDVSETLPSFIPLFREGEVERAGSEHPRAISVHREDGSLAHIDLLDRTHQNANAVIVGASGRGKSVFLGSLTHSLMSDPNVDVIKVDVGGSHSRECEMVRGVEYKLTLGSPSGLNPFEALKHNHSSEFLRSVLSQFIEVLVKEEGERTLSKALRAEIDSWLAKYIESKPGRPSLDGFCQLAKDFSRRHLLERWCGSGLYANAFRANVAASSSSDAGSCRSGPDEEAAFKRERQMTRLRYFNFSEIFQAADPEYAQALMAAVLVEFNLRMNSEEKYRLVLVCDETPFFIDRCFEFFRFSTANVRKFGGSVILVVQLSRHLVVGGDTSVIDNSHHRFLFSADGTKDEFAERMNLTDEEYDRLSKLELETGRASKLLYQEGQRSRILTLRLTPEEYWRVTSSQADRVKLDQLRNAAPRLSVEEAIRCLSFS